MGSDNLGRRPLRKGMVTQSAVFLPREIHTDILNQRVGQLKTTFTASKQNTLKDKHPVNVVFI